MHSPRWRFAHDWIISVVGNASPAKQWLRQVANSEMEALVGSLHPQERRVLEISGTFWQRDGLFKSYRSVDYPEFDICQDQLTDRFDLIIAEHVFEHLLWPYRAGRNVYEMLAPGGSFLIATPFLVRIHNHPVDCSRWTELGLRCLLQECGFQDQNILTKSWGNRRCVVANFDRWQAYRPWRDSLRNEPAFPMIVWALATR
jgi:SAM-dependent methyltransferase